MALNLRQLQRDQYIVEDDLRQARARLERYTTLGEAALAGDVRRVIDGLLCLQDTLTTRLASFSDAPSCR